MRNIKSWEIIVSIINIAILDTDEALVKDSELQSHLNALDEEEKKLIEEGKKPDPSKWIPNAPKE